MPPKRSQPPATAIDASPPSADSATTNRVPSTRPASRTLVAAKESSLFLSIPNTHSKALILRRQRLAREMSWWQLELEDWFNSYLPGEDLPDHLQWTPFNVDLTSEQTMYAGLRKGLQDAIETIGCHTLEARSTYRYPDGIPSSNGLPTRICPDLGIYPTSRPEPDAQESSAASQSSTKSIRVRFGSMEIPIEVKHLMVSRNTASSTGTSETPPSASTSNPSASFPNVDSASWSDVIMLSSESGYAIPLSLEVHRGQLVEYVIEVFNRQHRLFVFMILFVNDKGRLLRFDRTGVSMTVEFDYTQHPEIIGKFLRRVSGSRAAMGHDPTAVPADPADEELFRGLHTRYVSQSAVGRGLKDAATDGWRVYKLSIGGRFSPDHFTAVLPASPESRQEYLIGKPMFGNRSLSGRGTKTHIGYNLARDQVVVIKDSWRLNSVNVRPEYDTYLLLNEARRADSSGNFNIPTLLGGGDTVVAGAKQQTQTSNPDLLTRIHFRLVLKEVCRPLEDFASSSELVRVTLAALNAHSFAWVKAKILHRDVSIGNILILDVNPEELPDPTKSKGLLADWDLARTKAELENPTFTQRTRSGTWPFISARLQQSGSDQPHELSDDLESFVHVLNYCAMKYLPNVLSHQDSMVASFISRVYDHVHASGGGLEKGSIEKLHLLVDNKPFVELEPRKQPLQYLLDALSELCYEHYHHIQFPPPLHPPGQLREGTSLEVLKDNIDELGTTHVEEEDPPSSVLAISVDAENPAPEHPFRKPAAVRALPPPDPLKSPFKNHKVIGDCFRSALRPLDSHPYGIYWPVGDKIQRKKPLNLTPNVSVSRSEKRSSAGFPSYAPFGVANPEYSVPSKRARKAAGGSRGSRGSGSGSSKKVQRKALKTSADASRTRSEPSPVADSSGYIDPMALRSDGESSWSRSTTPESEGRFGEEDDADSLEPATNDGAPAPADDRPSHRYAERITDMAAELDEIQFG